MTFPTPPLDFDVEREIWNKYELADHTFLKVKVVLTRVTKVQQQQLPQALPLTQYSCDFQQVIIVLSNEHGTPDPTNYSPQQLQSSIIKDDIRYTTITQDWNEYTADDGTRLKIQPIVTRIAKTSKFNNKGDPIYWVELSMNIQIKPRPA